MKIVCEACKKVFNINDGKVSSRGSTINCPKCKHPHLVKRVVEPYPVESEYKKDTLVNPGSREISTDNVGNEYDLEKEATGSLRLRQDEIPPPTDNQHTKQQYNWKDLTKKQKKIRTYGGKPSFFKNMLIIVVRLFFFLTLLGFILGYIYLRSFPPEERKIKKE